MGYPSRVGLTRKNRVGLRVNPFLFRVKKIGFGSCFFWSGAMSIGGVVVVVWLCWSSVVVGSGFDCVGLGLIVLIWVCCDWFLDLGWFVNWVYGFDLLRIRCWLCLNLGKNMKNSMVLIYSKFDGVGFDDLWSVEFEIFLVVLIYVLVIWVWVLGLLGLCSCDGFEFLVVGFDLGRIWRTWRTLRIFFFKIKLDLRFFKFKLFFKKNF